MRTARRMAHVTALAALASIALAGCSTSAESGESKEDKPSKSEVLFEFTDIEASGSEVTVKLPDDLKDAIGKDAAEQQIIDSYTLTPYELDSREFCGIEAKITYVDKKAFAKGFKFTQTEPSKSEWDLRDEIEAEYTANPENTVAVYNLEAGEGNAYQEPLYSSDPFPFSAYWSWFSQVLKDDTLASYNHEYEYDIDAETLAIEAVGGPYPNTARGELITGTDAVDVLREEAEGEPWVTKTVEYLHEDEPEPGFYVNDKYDNIIVVSECAADVWDDSAVSLRFPVAITEESSAAVPTFSSRYITFTDFDVTVMLDGTITVYDDNQSFSVWDENQDTTYYELDGKGKWKVS